MDEEPKNIQNMVQQISEVNSYIPDDDNYRRLINKEDQITNQMKY